MTDLGNADAMIVISVLLSAMTKDRDLTIMVHRIVIADQCQTTMIGTSDPENPQRTITIYFPETDPDQSSRQERCTAVNLEVDHLMLLTTTSRHLKTIVETKDRAPSTSLLVEMAAGRLFKKIAVGIRDPQYFETSRIEVAKNRPHNHTTVRTFPMSKK